LEIDSEKVETIR